MSQWEWGRLLDDNCMGYIINLLSSCAQFFTLVFQSQVCFSISKAKPDGHRRARRPCTEHRTTSRQSSSAVKRKYSDGGRPLHSSTSFSLCVTDSAWRFTIDTDNPAGLREEERREERRGKVSTNKENSYQIGSSDRVSWRISEHHRSHETD